MFIGQTMPHQGLGEASPEFVLCAPPKLTNTFLAASDLATYIVTEAAAHLPKNVFFIPKNSLAPKIVDIKSRASNMF